MLPGTGVTRFALEIDGTPKRIGIPDAVFAAMGNGASAGVPEPEAATEVVSPMGGVLIRFTVEEGAEVSKGDQVALLEVVVAFARQAIVGATRGVATTG